MIHLLILHPVASGIAAYYLFSCVVGGMPAPTATSGPAYQWLHSSLHILAGNLNTAFASRFPNLATKGANA